MRNYCFLLHFYLNFQMNHLKNYHYFLSLKMVPSKMSRTNDYLRRVLW